MASTPRQTIPDDFVLRRACAICGAQTLRVIHLKSFPDYVACGNCKASFVLEADGERVLYGNIPETFPAARAAALRKWMSLAEIEAVAVAERPAPVVARPAAVPVPPEPPTDPEAALRAAASAAVPIPTEPEPPPRPLRGVLLQADESLEPPEEEVPEEEAEPEPASAEAPLERLSRLMAGAPDSEPVSEWAKSLVPDRKEAEAPPIPTPTPPSAAAVAATAAAATGAIKPPPPAAAPSVPVSPPAGDPPRGQRYRVALSGDSVTFPMRACAHCMTSPAPKRLTIIGTAPQGQAVAGRKILRYTVPLCRACYRRATARSPEEKNARLNAHLVSALVALALLVGALALGWIDPGKDPGLSIMVMAILLVAGYALPAMLLLGRAGRFPLGPDARYVRTTLHIPESSQGLETAFEWRNPRYAEEFHQANRTHALAGVVPVKDHAASD